MINETWQKLLELLKNLLCAGGNQWNRTPVGDGGWTFKTKLDFKENNNSNSTSEDVNAKFCTTSIVQCSNVLTQMELCTTWPLLRRIRVYASESQKFWKWIITKSVLIGLRITSVIFCSHYSGRNSNMRHLLWHMIWLGKRPILQLVTRDTTMIIWSANPVVVIKEMKLNSSMHKQATTKLTPLERGNCFLHSAE